MGESQIPRFAAFFIGLMPAISPRPVATNITAIAYISKRIGSSRHTLFSGFVYTHERIVVANEKPGAGNSKLF